MNNIEFYDFFAGNYDSMITPEKIINLRKEEFKKILSEDIKTAADIGSGTGNDSIALALNGLEVTGFEPSSGMIKQAKEKAKKFGVQVSFENYLSEKIPQSFYGKFDLAVSLGNSVSNIHRNVVGISFRKIYGILKKDSRFIFQILNYENIRKEGKRIINITGDEEKIFVRFYDFEKNGLIFNILTIEKLNYGNYELISTFIEEYKTTELTELLKKAGFRKTEIFGGTDFRKYDKSESKDVVIIAYK